MPSNDRKLKLIAKPRQTIPLVIDESLQRADVKHRPRLFRVLQEIGKDGQKRGFGFACSCSRRDDDILVGPQERRDSTLLGIA